MPPITTTANRPSQSKVLKAVNILRNEEPDAASGPKVVLSEGNIVNFESKLYSKSGSIVSINGNAPSELLDRTLMPPPRRPAPDGGYGWVIVFCSSCITSIVGASYVAFAICYVELVEAFGATKAVTGWIGSIYMATGSLLGEAFCDNF